MERAIIYLDEKQIKILHALSKYRKDDEKDDPLDETFLQNIFKVGLVDVVRFYSAQEKDPGLAEKANDYMSFEMLGFEITAEDLEKLWGPNEA